MASAARYRAAHKTQAVPFWDKTHVASKQTRLKSSPPKASECLNHDRIVFFCHLLCVDTYLQSVRNIPRKTTMGYFCVLNQQQKPRLQGSGVPLVPTSIFSLAAGQISPTFFLRPSNLAIYLATIRLLINWQGNDM